MIKISFDEAIFVSKVAKEREREKKKKKVLQEMKYDGSKNIKEYSKKEQDLIRKNLPYSGDYLLDLLNKPK